MVDLPWPWHGPDAVLKKQLGEALVALMRQSQNGIKLVLPSHLVHEFAEVLTREYFTLDFIPQFPGLDTTPRTEGLAGLYWLPRLGWGIYLVQAIVEAIPSFRTMLESGQAKVTLDFKWWNAEFTASWEG